MYDKNIYFYNLWQYTPQLRVIHFAQQVFGNSLSFLRYLTNNVLKADPLSPYRGLLTNCLWLNVVKCIIINIFSSKLRSKLCFLWYSVILTRFKWIIVKRKKIKFHSITSTEMSTDAELQKQLGSDVLKFDKCHF